MREVVGGLVDAFEASGRCGLVGDLCDVAKETGLHLHLVAHCRKPGGTEEGKPPTKYDIRGSAAISDQPHNIVMIWQNKAKRIEAEKREPDRAVMDKPDAIVSIEKQRNGPTGTVKLFFNKPLTKFDNLAPGSLGSDDY